MSDNLTNEDFYNVIDESWPGFILDHLRMAVEGGRTNEEIIGSLVFEKPPEPGYIYSINAAIDFIRFQQ